MGRAALAIRSRRGGRLGQACCDGHRLARVAGLPVEQLERLNMVRYSPGEYFNEHYDGKFRPRTVFIYLNDLPDADEGETLFPHLGLRFRPRCGAAVMWSNAT